MRKEPLTIFVDEAHATDIGPSVVSLGYVYQSENFVYSYRSTVERLDLLQPLTVATSFNDRDRSLIQSIRSSTADGRWTRTQPIERNLVPYTLVGILDALHFASTLGFAGPVSVYTDYRPLVEFLEHRGRRTGAWVNGRRLDDLYREQIESVASRFDSVHYFWIWGRRNPADPVAHGLVIV